MSADPQLLSLLEKVSNPIESLRIEIDLKGIFAPPEHWKTTDQANPNIFTYTFSMLNHHIENGKIIPRQLTEKQLKQAEEAKSKKGSKKDSKVEQQKKLTPEEEQLQQKRKAEWEALSQQQRFYRKHEDPYQAYSLKFEKNRLNIEFHKEQVNKFEDQINKNFIQFQLIRRPEINEQEINKLKKSKPKNLNLNQLNKFLFKGRINVQKLNKPGQTTIVQRVKISQIEQNLPNDAPRYDVKDTYVHITIILTPALVPLVEYIRPEVSQLRILKNKDKKGNLNELIRRLKGQIVTAVKSISTQYGNLYAKQKDYPQQKKTAQNVHISQIRIAQINKKKQFFLNEFNNSGKYTLIKNKIEKIIKIICLDKFKKQKTISKPTPQEIQKTFSQLYVFFNEQITATINDFLLKKPQQIHQDLLIGHRVSKQARAQIVSQLVNETIEQKYMRLSHEYQILNKLEQSQEYLQNLILSFPQNETYKFNYIRFGLRHKKYEISQILIEQLLKKSDKLQYKKIFGILLLRRNRYKQAFKIFKDILDDAKVSNPEKILYNQLISLIFEKQGEKKLSAKYKTMAEKLYKLKLNLPVKFDDQQDPCLDPKPKLPKSNKTVSLLLPQQSQDLQLNLLQVLADYNFYDILEESLHKIGQSYKKSLWQINCEIYKKNFSQANSLIDKMLEQNKSNYDLLMIKADICFFSEKLFQSQEVFLRALQINKDSQNSFSIYLRLGNVYLMRKAWEDAKIIFLKACEIKNISSLCWLGLGIAYLNLSEIKAAEQSLNMSNIYEPFNKSVEKYLQKVRQILTIKKPLSQSNYEM